jgi:hypothetical protein
MSVAMLLFDVWLSAFSADVPLNDLGDLGMK